MLEMKFSFWWFFLGLLVGVALDYFWWISGMSKHERRLEIFEHYHWGLTFLILMRMFIKLEEAFYSFAGIGFSLILAETTQKHPFAIKSSHDLPSTIIGFILIFLLISTYL